MSKKKTWTSVVPDGEVDLRMEDEGPASLEPVTVMNVLIETVGKYKDRPALRYKRPPKASIHDRWLGHCMGG